MTQNQSYRFNESDAEGIAKEHYGVDAQAECLDSYIDQNFLLRSADGAKYVLKFHNFMELVDTVDFQNQMMDHLLQSREAIACPRAVKNSLGKKITVIESPNGQRRYVRLLRYLEGKFWVEEKDQGEDLLEEVGGFLGRVDKVLDGFDHPGSRRDLYWDLKNAKRAEVDIDAIEDPKRRALVQHFLMLFEVEAEPVLQILPKSVIHNDGNDYNVLIARDGSGNLKVSGIIDFGDSVYTYRVCEVAVAAAYAAFSLKDPVAGIAAVVRGYCKNFPLSKQEIGVIFYLVAARLCTSVISSAKKIKQEPDNTYLLVSEKPAWRVLEELAKVNPIYCENVLRKACGFGPKSNESGSSVDEILKMRDRALGPSLSVSYEQPLKIIKGYREFLFDDRGGAYLDMVNNVSHVGHCHPVVVKAMSRQMALLNTNTRYLHDILVDYANRLLATMPSPLSVCFFVCSGSEANELALRMARTHTGRRNAVILDGAYHGNTSSIVELSPYKFDGKGGEGAASHVHMVPMPDVYRGQYKADDKEAGSKYAGFVGDALKDAHDAGTPAAMFLCESLLGCGGQIVLPAGYMKAAHEHVKEAGAVFVADEVQVGFGRVGSHFWGFETQGVVPDIVTLGKPIGNGHPLAAVVTTREIAQSFNNGMEYFNTFGGNPVSCATGMAVLDVIESEGLQQNALEVGDQLKADLMKLKPKYDLIGDVRGQGLFIGVELVKDHQTLAPAAQEATLIVERMKEMNILLSTDGPLHNVLKIKPPIVFTKEDANRFVIALDKVFFEMES